MVIGALCFTQDASTLGLIVKAWLLIRPQVGLDPTPMESPPFFLEAQETKQVVLNLASQYCWEASQIGPVSILIFLLRTPGHRWVNQCLVCYPISQSQRLEKNQETCLLLFVQGEQ